MVAVTMQEQRRIANILSALVRTWPEARCSLLHQDPLQLLVATILSAQCTDERVNQVTPRLSRRFSDAEAFAAADLSELEEIIRPLGFFRHKARHIRSACRSIVENHGSQVPGTMETLTSLPGVGRKTANVLLGNAFGIPGITVDTHVQRLSQRLGLSSEKEPGKIEQDLMRIVPRQKWTDFSHQMIMHGRAICHARRPDCGHCPLVRWCPSAQRT
jgi:endonuclease III